jgi:hypothetical protein
LLVMLGGLAPRARAQRPGWPRSGTARAPVATYSERLAAEPDPLRPYAPEPRADSRYRPYLRAPAAPPRDEAITRAAAPRREYFPGLRSGQGPNRNVVDPRTLCVPGRRAMLQR